VLRIKSVVFGAAEVAVTAVFFPAWFAVPVAVVLGALALGLAVLGASVVLNQETGLLLLRRGLIFRRVRFTDVTAVLVDQAKVSVARTNGGEISVYVWRKGPLDALLGVPAVASDVGHAISRCVALAQAAPDPEAAAPEERPADAGKTPARVRSRQSAALLSGWGVVTILAALLVRVHWHDPVLTVLGVILALGLGVTGLLSLLFGLWILLTGRAPELSQTM